jgi:hypothetical protein
VPRGSRSPTPAITIGDMGNRDPCPGDRDPQPQQSRSAILGISIRAPGIAIRTPRISIREPGISMLAPNNPDPHPRGSRSAPPGISIRTPGDLDPCPRESRSAPPGSRSAPRRLQTPGRRTLPADAWSSRHASASFWTRAPISKIEGLHAFCALASALLSSSTAWRGSEELPREPAARCSGTTPQ